MSDQHPDPQRPQPQQADSQPADAQSARRVDPAPRTAEPPEARPSPAPNQPQSPTGASEHPQISYEDARDQLVEVVRRLESGSVPLSDSMELWERGEKLAAVCQAWLDGAKARIDQARPSSGR